MHLARLVCHTPGVYTYMWPGGHPGCMCIYGQGYPGCAHPGMHVCIHMYVYVYTYMYIHVHVARGHTPGVFIYIYIHKHINIWPGARPGMYVCVYVYICTCGRGLPLVCLYRYMHDPPGKYMFCGRGLPVLPASIYVVPWSKLHACMGCTHAMA